MASGNFHRDPADHPPNCSELSDFLLRRFVEPASWIAPPSMHTAMPEVRQVTFDHITPARSARRPPVVMTREEIRSVFARLEDPWKLIAQVMYGGGLRLMEAMRLRVKDLDFWPGHHHHP